MGIPSGYVSGQVVQAVVGVGKVLQVVSTNLNTTFSTSSTSFTDITGMSVSITPQSATSKILVLANLSMGLSGDVYATLRLMRDSTAIGAGATASTRPLGFSSFLGGTDGSFAGWNPNYNFLDSPATTAATTYKIQVIVNTGTVYLNRSGNDADGAQFNSRTASTITVMEISA